MSKSKTPEHLKGVSTTGGAFTRADSSKKFERDESVQQTTGAPEAKPKAAPPEPAEAPTAKRTTKS